MVPLTAAVAVVSAEDHLLLGERVQVASGGVEQQWLLLSREARVELDLFGRLRGSSSLCRIVELLLMTPSWENTEVNCLLGKECFSSSFLRVRC